MGRILRFLHGSVSALFLVLILHIGASAQNTTFFYEGFEDNGENLPTGWVNAMVVGNESWLIGEGAGPFPEGQVGLPDTAAFGERNAFFRVPSFNPYISRLITPAIDLEFAVNPELTFWHAQVPRDGSNAKLGVYIATSPTGPWTLIASYQNPVNQWIERVLSLPGSTNTLYLAFEGHSGQGLGGSVCVDEVTIVETGTLPRELSAVNSYQPTTFLVHTGSQNNEVLKTELRVIGNTGTLTLESFKVVSLNTSDADIPPQGVKLWYTTNENFTNPHQLGTAQSFSNGQVIFNQLNHTLPTGYSYLWVTCDVGTNAQPGNYIDVKLPANGITVNGQAHPSAEQDPTGTRKIYETIFYDDFELDKGWSLTGEWQRAEPQGLGGQQETQSNTSGPAGPDFAVSGTKVIGTDITGLGTYPGNYEPMLPPLAYVATTPEISTDFYADVRLSFQRWLNVHLFDNASIDISTDNGVTWTTIWDNQQVQNTSTWNQISYVVPRANRQPSVRFRFTLGETGGTNLQSGWHLDNLVVTGTYVTTDVGISALIAPFNTCNLTSQEEVTVTITNFGASATPSVIPVAYSIDNGQSWQRDTLRTSIPVGESHNFTFGPRADFSVPGIYDNILLKTELAGDQDDTNDLLQTSVFSLPVFIPAYSEDFQESDHYWASYGDNSSLILGTPMGGVIDEAASGSFSWVTNPFGNYQPNELSWVESPCFDFSGMPNPVLDFFLNYHLPNGLDGAAIDYSIDGGQTWSRLEPRSPDLAWYWYNHNNISALASKTGNGRGWSGLSNGWLNPRIVLPEEVGNQSSVRFRLIFASQEVALDFEGVAFDMVSVYGAQHDVGVTAFMEPLTSCSLSDVQNVTVAVENLGINTIPAGTQIPVGLDYHTENISLLETLTVEEALSPGENALFTFSQAFDMSAIGMYNLTAYTLLEGDDDFFSPGIFNDTLSVTVEVFGTPVVDLGEDIYTTQPLSVVLDAGAGHASYLWQDGSTNQTFQVTSPNTQIYWVTVGDTNACTATDSIRVVTYDLGLTAIVAPLNGCQAPEGEQVKVEITNEGPDAFETGTEIPLRLYFQNQWLEDKTWQLSQNLNPGQSTVATFNSVVNLSADGDYQVDVSHQLHDANSANDSIHSLVSSLGYPTVSLGDSIYTLMPDTVLLDPGPGYANYIWQDGSTNQTFQVTSPNTQTYWVTVFDSQDCSATAEVVVATFDAGITQIVSPGDACALDESEPVTLALHNHGVDPFEAGKTFGITLYVDGLLEAEEILTLESDWAAGQTLNHTLQHTLSIQDQGTYSLAAEITTRDANPANDDFQKSLVIHGYPILDIPEMVVTNQPDTVILDAGPGHSSYEWSTGATSQTISITSWGTYQITVFNDFGCETTGSIQVTPELMDLGMEALVTPTDGCANEFIDAPVIVQIVNAGNVVVPQGEELTIHYNVDDEPMASEQFTTTQTLQPGETHSFTFAGTLTLAEITQARFDLWLEHPADENAGNDALESIVNINPLPQPELGDTIFNAEPVGQVLQLTETYESYYWNDGSTGTEYVITSPYSQWYHVTVTDNNGCANTDSVMVVAWDLEVYDLLSPLSNCTLSTSEQVVFVMRNNGPDTFQSGRKFRIGYSVNENPATFQDFTLNSSLGPGQFRTFAFSQGANLEGTGTFDVEVFIDEPDVSDENNNFLNVVEAPGLPFVELGDDIYTLLPDTVFLDAGPGFSGYLWQDGNTNQIYNVYEYGWHYVMVTDHYGCQNGDTLYVGESTGVPLIGIPGTDVTVYPNPAREEVTVRIVQENMEALRLELLNQTGSRILERELEMTGLLEEKIQTGRLQPGLYYIRLSGKQGVITRKLIVTNRR
ncbi:MAG: T9SS type A sorting domain-containing protein [Bacteroides sp.]|jgi:hypothetical protein|nr:T9SS type A sorting domain-containing protein [Bacteroides sp.]